jgi:predicted transcriptional regulator
MDEDSGRSPRRRAGELEADVLAALWAASRPVTAMQIRDSLGGQLAYNTVHTVVTRLAAKGLITRDPDRRGAWRPATDPVVQAAQLMAQVLNRGPDRSAVLQRFIGTLNAADETALRAMLDRNEP